MATLIPIKETPHSTATTQETTEVSVIDRAIGAAFISSGIGALVLGLAIVLTESPANVGLKNALTWNSDVGPLSGKTGVAVIAFLLSWVILHFVFQTRPAKLMTSFIITVVLVGLGMLFSFPPFFELFAK
jgi:hypothetical protein